MLRQLMNLLIFFMILTMGACAEANSQGNLSMDARNQQVKHMELMPKQEVKRERAVTLLAVGDILIHDRVYNDAEMDSGQYDFMPMLKTVQPYLEDATVTIANQETMIGGQDIGLSSYPQFNSPYEIGSALKEVGVDVVSIANNHTLDRGDEAISNAINHWKKIGMMYTGAYQSEKDKNQLRVVQTSEGIDLAFLSYTYGTNGIPIPTSKPYLVNLINNQQMSKDINHAEQIADATIVSLHFGNEYERMPNEHQKELAQYASDLGADIIIGHHPHVLQPVEWLEGENGNRTFVAYSLGNFLSGQDEFYNRIGGAVRLTIKMDKDNQVLVENPTFLPTFVDYQMKNNKMTNFDVLPMYQVTNQQLEGVTKHYQQMKAHMSQWVPELSFLEEK